MPSHYPHPVIAHEGRPFIVISAVIAGVVTLLAGWWWAAPLWLITLFMLQFFRDPARDVPTDSKAVLSPADGRIVVVEKTLDPYRDREALKISVFMNVFNVHSNRSPIDGWVQKVEYHAGSFFNAAIAKASLANECNAILLKTVQGVELTIVQVAGLVARRILCYTHEGEMLSRGQRYGFIRFGSRVDVYLPLEVSLCVAIGDKVSASETILARLP